MKETTCQLLGAKCLTSLATAPSRLFHPPGSASRRLPSYLPLSTLTVTACARRKINPNTSMLHGNAPGHSSCLPSPEAPYWLEQKLLQQSSTKGTSSLGRLHLALAKWRPPEKTIGPRFRAPELSSCPL